MTYIIQTAQLNRVEDRYTIKFDHDIYTVECEVDVEHVVSGKTEYAPAVDEYIPEINYMLITK
jgi:hypothetical protein